jgi:hypothetical protein
MCKAPAGYFSLPPAPFAQNSLALVWLHVIEAPVLSFKSAQGGGLFWLFVFADPDPAGALHIFVFGSHVAPDLIFVKHQQGLGVAEIKIKDQQAQVRNLLGHRHAQKLAAML